MLIRTPFSFLLAALVLLIALPTATAQAPSATSLDAVTIGHAERFASVVPTGTALEGLVSYDFDLFEDGDFLDRERSAREYDAQDRLVRETAATSDPFAENPSPYETQVDFTYAPNGLIATRTISNDRSGTFLPTERLSYAYDGTLLSSLTEETFADGSFVPTSREVYEYDGALLSRITYQEEIDGALSPTGRTTFLYDGNSTLARVVDEIVVAGAFKNDARTTFTEVGPDLVVLEERWDEGAWEQATRSIYQGASLSDLEAASGALARFTPFDDATPSSFVTRAATFNVSTDATRFYDALAVEDWDGTSWAPRFRTTVTRNADRVAGVLSERWEEGAWQNSSRETYTYDADERTTTFLSESWSGAAWSAAVEYAFTYGSEDRVSEDRVSEVVLSVRTSPSGSLETLDRTRFAWANAVANENDALTADATLALDGPNPFSERTALTFALDAPAEASVTVYDLLGRAVLTLADDAFAAGPHRVEFAADALPAGVYVVQLVSGSQASMQTVTLVR